MNSEQQRQHIKSQLNDNIKKYEQERNLEKEHQERQKLLIKKNILEQLISKQRNSSNGSTPNSETEYAGNGAASKNEFSYSFGNKGGSADVSREEKTSNCSDGEESQRQDLPMATQLPSNFLKQQAVGSAITFAAGNRFLNSETYQKMYDNSVRSGEGHSHEEEPSGQGDTLDQFQEFKESRKSNSYKSQKDQLEQNLTESSRYGAYFLNNRQNQHASYSQLATIPSAKTLEKEPEVAKPTPKKENILNLFPSEQFGPKPKSPIRRLQYVHHSPPKAPGSIYSITDKASYKESPLKEFTKKADRPPIIDMEMSSHSMKALPYHSMLSQKTTESREQPSTAKKESPIRNNLGKQTSPVNPMETFGRGSPKIPGIGAEKTTDMPALKRLPNAPVPLAELEREQKAYGTFIHDDADDDHIEQLRKKKLEELEKKRQKRTSDRKKSADEKSHKEPTDPSHHSTTQQTFHPQPGQPPTNKYSAIHRKAREQEDAEVRSNQTITSYKSLSKPMDARGTEEVRRVVKPEVHRQQQELTQNRSHNSVNYIENSQSIVPFSDNKHRDSSPNATPKTITTNKTTKTLNSRSIFEYTSPGRSREKSGHKFTHEPKIEPKERKQTFTKQSNRTLMINAITKVCLPDEINRKEREKLIDIINGDPGEFFVFLFKESFRKLIKAIYTYDNASGRVRRIYGEKAPAEITAENVFEFYRYDSGAKEFKILSGCKSFSYVVHGVLIK